MSTSPYQQQYSDKDETRAEQSAPGSKLVPPWVSPDAFPPKPLEHDYGYLGKRRKRVSCEGLGELSQSVGADKNGRIRLVWTPAHRGMVPPEEVPALFDTLLLRNIRRYTQLRNWSIISLVLWGFLLFVNRTRPEILPIYLINILALGVIPIAQSVWELRKLRNYTQAEMARDIVGARYRAWTGTRHAVITWGLGISVSAIALVQFLSTISNILAKKPSPIEAAGLVKDAVWNGEVWRLLTGPLLHGNFLHLYFNVAALLVLGAIVEALTGWAFFAILLLLSILGGSICSLLLLPATSVGISGGLMGLIGFLAIMGYFHKEYLPPGFLKSMLYVIALTAALGVLAFSYIDNAAHLGGLITGALLGFVFLRRRTPKFPLPTNQALYFAGILSTGILLASVLLTLALMLR